MKLITFNLMDSLQKVLLFLIIAFILLTTPSSWVQYPDTGIYLGTAESMLDSFRYWFNGHPNLLYYPGMSSLLLLPLSIVGDNFLVLQLYVAAISLTGIWCIRKYYSYQSYGAIGFFLPFIILFSSIYSIQIYALTSDCIFLTITMLALLFWRKFESTDVRKYLFWCVLLVSTSALVRFQGVFIFAALSLALFIRAWRHDDKKRSFNLWVALLVSAIIILPFLLWTMRNFFSYTPDTFNMANSYFFGLRGLDLYAKGLSGGVSSEHVNSSWQFPLYRSALYIGGLFEFLYGGISLNNKIIVLPALLILMLLGIKPWSKRANHLEFFYVVFSGLFLAKSVLSPHNLHVILRYWIPLLPFVFLMIGLGIQTIIDYPLFAPIKKYMKGGALFSIVLLLIIAFPNISKHIKLENYRYQESEALKSLKSFIDKNLPLDAIVATTDWGIVPRIINRHSYLVLNDPKHKQTITRMLKYKTEFLVTYGKFPRMNDPALAMIVEYPDAFTLLFSKNKDQPSLSIFVYKVNLKVLSKYV